MAKQKSDERCRIGHAFLAAWGEMLSRGWRAKVTQLSCSLGKMQGESGWDSLYQGGAISIEDIELVNEVVEAQPERHRMATHHYFRRDGIFKETRTILQVAEHLGYNDAKQCRKDLESVELVVYGRLFPKLPGADAAPDPEPPRPAPAEDGGKFPPKSWHRPILKLKQEGDA
jgi:hypothetical protein